MPTQGAKFPIVSVRLQLQEEALSSSTIALVMTNQAGANLNTEKFRGQERDARAINRADGSYG
jgi:hypothetical protein